MKTFFISTAIFALAAAGPAHAQLLGGGGGIGGMIGGTLGGHGTISGPLSAPAQTARSATSGTLDTSAKAEGSKSVDTRSGSAAAAGSADAGIGSTVASATQAPVGNIAGSGTASGSASGNGSANAQLIGTDQVRSTLGSAVGTANSVGAQAQGTVSGETKTAKNIAGSATGSMQGSANGMTNLTTSPLAAVGSAAAQADGAFAIASGTPVSGPDSATLGTVSQVIADASGQVEQVQVEVDGVSALLPAGNFSASGNALVSAMSEGEVRQLAAEQAEESPAE